VQSPEEAKNPLTEFWFEADTVIGKTHQAFPVTPPRPNSNVKRPVRVSVF